MVLLKVKCRSICNKILEFWNLIDTYNPDVVIGTESWLSEGINSAEVSRDDYITFRRDRCFWGGRVFMCVKNYIDCRELWTVEDSEMVVGIYRAPNKGMRVLERLAVRTGYTGNSTKHSINGGYLNPTQTGMETRVEIAELRHLQFGMAKRLVS